MLKEISVHFSHLLLSCSTAIDIANNKIANHQLRTAFIAWELTKVAKISSRRIEQIFIGALLHDVGALTPEEKTDLHNFEVTETRPHAIRGAALLNSSPLLREAAQMVKFHHRPWNEWDEEIDSDNVFAAQILYLSDYVERLIDREKCILHQNDEILAKIVSMKGIEIHPDIVDLLTTISGQESFWLDLISPHLYSMLRNNNPFKELLLNVNSIFSIAPFFKNLIDFKSRFTATHSSGVIQAAAMIADYFGLTKHEIALIELAGGFHDIGKLSIPTSILEKPGKLTKGEFAIIKTHPYYSYIVLNMIGGVEYMAECAAFHHEKLDGSGYPFHIDGNRISTPTRIIAVADVFTALAEDRPYRWGLNIKTLENVFSDMTAKKYLDKKITKILLNNYSEIVLQVKEKQALAREEFERIDSLN